MYNGPNDDLGGIAQLGERCNGIAEVSGSIPLTSTNLKTAFMAVFLCLNKEFIESILSIEVISFEKIFYPFFVQ